MVSMKKMILSNEKGFVLLAAIMASLILLAVGMLVANMSTGDLLSSSVTVGNKKALAAVESGVHTVVHTFNPLPSTWIEANNYTIDCAAALPNYHWRPISSGTVAGIDVRTRFAVCAPWTSLLAPVPVPGHAIESWGMMRYNGGVVGENTSYNSRAKVDIGIGYGPVPMN
jgi:hypothetical protein